MITIQLVGEPKVRERERTPGFRQLPAVYSHLYLNPADHESFRVREQLSLRQQIRLYRRLLPSVYARLGLPPETTAHWRSLLGCRLCHCSPGFRLDLPGLAIWHDIAIREVVDQPTS